MNEEEEEAPLEDPRVCRNCLRWEKHTIRFEEQLVADASRRAIQRTVCNNAQIALEIAVRANAQTLLHPDRQQEMRNANRQAHQGHRE